MTYPDYGPYGPHRPVAPKPQPTAHDARARTLAHKAGDSVAALGQRVSALEARDAQALDPNQARQYMRLRRIGMSNADAITIAARPRVDTSTEVEIFNSRTGPVAYLPGEPVDWRSLL